MTLLENLKHKTMNFKNSAWFISSFLLLSFMFPLPVSIPYLWFSPSLRWVILCSPSIPPYFPHICLLFISLSYAFFFSVVLLCFNQIPPPALCSPWFTPFPSSVSLFSLLDMHWRINSKRVVPCRATASPCLTHKTTSRGELLLATCLSGGALALVLLIGLKMV